MAADDTDVQAMLADLANNRRDILVAPEGGGGRRGDNVSDRVRSAVAREDFQARQARLAGPVENKTHQMLQAWNDAATFSRDEIAEQQGDRWGGQGHRAALNEKMRVQHGDERTFTRTSEGQNQGKCLVIRGLCRRVD